MFHANAKNKVSAYNGAAARARDASVAAANTAAQSAAAAAQTAAHAAAQTATAAAQTAAQGMNSAAQTAAAGVSKGARQGVYTARGWAAPKLESAADYVTASAAPKVSSALRSTAKQVRPNPPKSRMRSALTWSLFGAAIVAALGAAGAVIRQRYQAAMAADTEVDEAEETSAQADAAAKPDAKSAGGTSKDAGVNGRVSASGW